MTSAVALVLSACGNAGYGRAAINRDAASNRCALFEVSRRPLMLGSGNDFYVEPMAVVVNSRGSTLLAGRPNYQWIRNDQGRPIDLIRDRLLGAIVDSDDRAQPVASPIDAAQIGTVRAAARDDGSWDVLLAELKSYPKDQYPPRTDSVVRVWHGVLEGTSWRSLEALPLPPGVQLFSTGNSQLIQRAGRLAWAARASTAEFNTNVVLYKRDDSGWSFEIIPTKWASYTSVLETDSTRLSLIVAGLDTANLANGSATSSLFLWEDRSGWTNTRRLASGQGDSGPAHPTVMKWGNQWILTWANEGGRWSEIKTAVGLSPDSIQLPTTSIDKNVPRSDLHTTVVLGTPLWATVHEPREGAPREIRFTQLGDTDVEEIGSIRSPFLGRFGATAIQPSDLLLTGALLKDEGASAVSLLLRLRLVCEPAGTRVIAPGGEYQSPLQRR